MGFFFESLEVIGVVMVCKEILGGFLFRGFGKVGLIGGFIRWGYGM